MVATMVEDRLLTVEQVAQRLQFSEETVRRWIRDGRLRATLMGSMRGGYRVRESDVEATLQRLGERRIAEEPEGYTA